MVKIEALCSKLENGEITEEECNTLGKKLNDVWRDVKSHDRYYIPTPDELKNINILIIFHIYLIRKLGILHPLGGAMFFDADLNEIKHYYEEAKKTLKRAYKTIPAPNVLSFESKLEVVDINLVMECCIAFIKEIRTIIAI